MIPNALLILLVCGTHVQAAMECEGIGIVCHSTSEAIHTLLLAYYYNYVATCMHFMKVAQSKPSILLFVTSRV